MSSSLTQLFFTIRKLALRNNDKKNRDLLTKKIVLYTRLNYFKPTKISLNDFEQI